MMWQQQKDENRKAGRCVDRASNTTSAGAAKGIRNHYYCGLRKEQRQQQRHRTHNSSSSGGIAPTAAAAPFHNSPPTNTPFIEQYKKLQSFLAMQSEQSLSTISPGYLPLFQMHSVLSMIRVTCHMHNKYGNL